MQELLDKYLTQNKMYFFEGQRGVRNLERVMQEVCGYSHWSTLQSFLEDNPGAMEAILNWIAQQRTSEWQQNLVALVGDESEEDDASDREPEWTEP